MKRQLLLAAICLLLLISFGTAANAERIDLSFNPISSNITVGDSFSVDLFASIPTIDIDPVASWGLGLDFDPSYMALESISLGSGWGSLGSPSADFFGGAAFPSPINGSVLLASFDFVCLGEGSSSLQTFIDSSDANYGFYGFGMGGEVGNRIAFDSAVGTVNQTASVPEPATVFLMGTGCLLGGALIRHKRRI